MKLVFIGPQGSGKGTQAKIISEKLNIPHISTGDLLRNAEGELKEKINSILNSGKLISDELVLDLLKKRISEDDTKNGFILDGFPRNLKQAKMLKKITKIDKIIEISISDEESIRRLSGRLNCKNCGAIYNINTGPKPKIDNKCDKCNSDLYQREDDKPEAIKRRLETYHKETEPILENYPHVKIDGEQSIEKVTQDILNALNPT